MKHRVLNAKVPFTLEVQTLVDALTSAVVPEDLLLAIAISYSFAGDGQKEIARLVTECASVIRNSRAIELTQLGREALNTLRKARSAPAARYDQRTTEEASANV